MGLSDVLGTTMAVFRRRLGLFLALAAVPLVGSLVVVLILYAIIFVGAIGVFAQLGSTPSTGQIAGIIGVGFVVYLVMALAIGLVNAYAQGLMVNAARETMEHRYPSLSQVRELTRGFLGRYVGVYLLLTAGAMVGVFAVFLPVLGGLVAAIGASMSGSRAASDDALTAMLAGIGVSMLLYLVFIVVAAIIGIRTIFMAPITAVEGLSGMAILKRSWALTRGSFWRILGYLFVLGLIMYAISTVVSMISQAVLGVSTSLSGGSGDEMAQIMTMLPALGVSVLLSFAVQLVMTPVMMIYLTVMYVDQIRRSQMPTTPAYGTPQGYRPQAYGQPGAHGQPGYGQQGPWAPTQGGQPPYGTPSPGSSPYGSQPHGPQPGAQPPYGQAQPPYGSGQNPPYGR